MTDGIEWDKAPEDCPIIPVDRPNRSALRGIPLGVPALLVNLKEDGTEFSSAEWDAETRDLWISDLDDEEERFPRTALFYVNPRFLKEDPNLPVLSEDEVVEKAMAEYLTLEVGDVEDIPAFLNMVVRIARQGMTVNPF